MKHIKLFEEFSGGYQQVIDHALKAKGSLVVMVNRDSSPGTGGENALGPDVIEYVQSASPGCAMVVVKTPKDIDKLYSGNLVTIGDLTGMKKSDDAQYSIMRMVDLLRQGRSTVTHILIIDPSTWSQPRLQSMLARCASLDLTK